MKSTPNILPPYDYIKKYNVKKDDIVPVYDIDKSVFKYVKTISVDFAREKNRTIYYFPVLHVTNGEIYFDIGENNGHTGSGEQYFKESNCWSSIGSLMVDLPPIRNPFLKIKNLVQGDKK